MRHLFLLIIYTSTHFDVSDVCSTILDSNVVILSYCSCGFAHGDQDYRRGQPLQAGVPAYPGAMPMGMGWPMGMMVPGMAMPG